MLNRSGTTHPLSSVLRELFLILIAVLLFVGIFPGLFSQDGFAFGAYFCLLPVFLLIYRLASPSRSGEHVFRKSAFYGFIYGYFSYLLFNSWLLGFEPTAFFLVPLIYASYFTLLFPLLVGVTKLFPRKAWIFHILFWMCYEILRATGYLGYTYGNLGLSQYRFTALIGAADLVGAHGISSFTVFPAAVLARFLRFFRLSLRPEPLPLDPDIKIKTKTKEQPSPASEDKKENLLSLLRRDRDNSFFLLKSSAFFILLFSAALIYTRARRIPDPLSSFSVRTEKQASSPQSRQSDQSDRPDRQKPRSAAAQPPGNKQNRSSPSFLRVALIQQNVDAWEEDNILYRESMENLLRLSREAEPFKPDLLVWSETAYIPSYRLYTGQGRDPDRIRMTRRLREFLKKYPAPLLMGNNDTFIRNSVEKTYNAALLLKKGEIKQVYYKNHLVPFSEYFPFTSLPFLRNYLKKIEGKFYEPGKELKLLRYKGIALAPLICFEDSFPAPAGKMVRRGADLLVNLSNDGWTQDPAAARQHLTNAVFRSVETRRTTIRATNTGITAVITPNGDIPVSLKPYTQDFLVSDIPLPKNPPLTFYTRYREGIEVSWFLLTLLLLLFFSLQKASRPRPPIITK